MNKQTGKPTPATWPNMQLRDVATIRAGGKLGLTKVKNYISTGYPAFSAAGQDGFVDRFEFEGSSVILSAIGARCGKCFYATGKWTTLANTYIIRANPTLFSNRFLWYLLNDEDYWHRSGTAVPFISPRDIRSTWVHQPTRQEQNTIVEQLDLINDICLQHQLAINKLETLKNGFLEKLKQGKFFPRHDIYKLNEACTLSMGETIIAKDLTPTGIPVFSADTKPKPWGHHQAPQKVYPQGTIIISARGSIGHPRLPRFDSYTSTQTTIAVFPNKQLLQPKYLQIWLKTLDYDVLTSVQAVPMLTIKSLSTAQIHIPAKPVQNKIIHNYATIQSVQATHKDLFVRYTKLLTGMKHRLLYGQQTATSLV